MSETVARADLPEGELADALWSYWRRRLGHPEFVLREDAGEWVVYGQGTVEPHGEHGRVTHHDRELHRFTLS